MNSQKTTPSPSPFPVNTPDQPAAGKGMPARDPKPQRSLPGQYETPQDRSVENTLELPHDRDQAVDMTGTQSSLRVEQAAEDVERGLKDTSKALEMNQAYKKQKS